MRSGGYERRNPCRRVGDEDRSIYILEWVAHYETSGFDHILVCTNDCTDTTVDILRRMQEMGPVTQHDTVVRKADIHRSALRQSSRRYDIVLNAKWAFVCNVDEVFNVHIGDGSGNGWASNIDHVRSCLIVVKQGPNSG
ncbi:glycosyltransferase family 2 protein [Roseovarius sp.]|uniref:glycosyltransferase family 2 protein n=1 Tax=Roseovarius sp. TaxID=1486281 RepID=UPI003A977D29